MKLQNRIGIALGSALAAALLTVMPVCADPQLDRVVPDTLTLDIGGDSKLLAFSGSDLQLIKEVTVASANADQFSLSLGPVSADSTNRQLLIKANNEAVPGIYRLRVLYSTRGGLLLNPRLIKLRVVPGNSVGRVNGKAVKPTVRSSRPLPVSDDSQPWPGTDMPAAISVAPAGQIAEPAIVRLDDDIPPEPEVVDESGQSIAGGRETATRSRGDNESFDGDNESFDSDKPQKPAPESFRPSSAGTANPAPTVVSGQLPAGSLSAAMLGEAMGEPSPSSEFLRDNEVTENENGNTWLKLARSDGDILRLTLLTPEDRRSFMKGEVARAQEVESASAGAQSQIDLPPGVNIQDRQRKNAAAITAATMEKNAPVEPVSEFSGAEEKLAKRLPTPSPPARLPRTRRVPLQSQKQAAASRPKTKSSSTADSQEMVEANPIIAEVVPALGNGEVKIARPLERDAVGAEKPTATPGTVGMRALPVYWIRGMAPTAMLVGSVRNAQTGEPVVGAKLELGSMVAKTTAAGLYSLPSEDDSRQLKISADGYLPMKLTAPRQSGAQMDEVDVSLIPVESKERDETLPDLMVVSPPTRPLCRGDKQAVRVRIFNAGRTPIKNYDVTIFSRQWRDSGSPDGVNDDPISIDGPPLGSGETQVVDIPVTIAADSLWAEMTAEVDAKSRYDELLETNNRSNPRRIVVAALPDCKSADAKKPDYAMLPSLSVLEADGGLGCQLETAVTLANYSNKVAPPISVTLQINSAGDLIFNKVVELEALQPAEQRALQFAAPVDTLLRALSQSLSLPSLLPDQRMTLSVEVNAGLEQEERFTSNNRVEFSGRLSELIATENLLYRKRGEVCLAKL